MEQMVRAAMESLRDELRTQNLDSGITPEQGDEERVALIADLGDDQNFIYRVCPRSAMVPAVAIRPDARNTSYYQLEFHLNEGGQGYDLMDCTSDQIIEYILDQYERHLSYLRRYQEVAGSAAMPD